MVMVSEEPVGVEGAKRGPETVSFGDWVVLKGEVDGVAFSEDSGMLKVHLKSGMLIEERCAFEAADEKLRNLVVELWGDDGR